MKFPTCIDNCVGYQTRLSLLGPTWPRKEALTEYMMGPTQTVDRQPRALEVDELSTSIGFYGHKGDHLGCSDMVVCRGPSVTFGPGCHFSK